MTVITGYRDYDSNEMVDTDFTPFDMMRVNLVYKEKSKVQELRLASLETQSELKWICGLYHFDNESYDQQTNYYRAGMAGKSNNPFNTGTGTVLIDTKNQNSGYALFGQSTYRFFEELDFTVGVRYEHEDLETDSKAFKTPDGGFNNPDRTRSNRVK